jgi:hypothetical protein
LEVVPESDPMFMRNDVYAGRRIFIRPWVTGQTMPKRRVYPVRTSECAQLIRGICTGTAAEIFKIRSRRDEMALRAGWCPVRFSIKPK